MCRSVSTHVRPACLDVSFVAFSRNSIGLITEMRIRPIDVNKKSRLFYSEIYRQPVLFAAKKNKYNYAGNSVHI